MTTTITFNLGDPSIKEKLAVLPERMVEWAYEVIMEQAHLIVGLAQVAVNVDTGSLRDSIRVERGGEGLHWRQVRVRAGGYIVNPKTGRYVDYATYVEARYPFLGPSVASVEPTIQSMIHNRILEKATKD